MCGKAALVLCFAAVAIWTSDILDDEFHAETASHHQVEAVLKEEQEVPMSSPGFLRRLSLPGDVQLAKQIVAKSGGKNREETPVPVRVLSGGWTPLHTAARIGDVSEVKALLAKGADVNAKGGYFGETPLHSAAIHGHVAVVKELLAKGAEVDAKNKYGETPLHDAADYGHEDVVKELLAKGAEVNAKDEDGSTPLQLAARDGHVDMVKELLAKGAEADAKTNKYGWTPLHYAVSNGHMDVLKELLANGAEVNAKTKHGQTPLHFSARDGHVAVVKELLAKGAEVDAKDEDGKTPLHWAAYNGNADVVNVLLTNSAEVDAKNKDGETPLHRAADHGHADVVKVLLTNSAEVDAKNKDGETPLLEAAYNGHADVVKVLMSNGAQLDASFQEAKKPNESSEAPKTLTGLLQHRCLPEVAEWAVNHSYTIDSFPGQASTARSCVLQYMSFETRARRAVGSIWSYVYPGAGAAAAAVSVYVVEPLILRHFGSNDAPDQEERHPFYRGAHLLVAKAAMKWYWPKMAFRFCEVMTIIACFLGFAMVLVWWVWWLPFVGLLFLLPGIKLYGSKELMRAPVKCIAAMNTKKGYAWSLLRVVLLVCLIALCEYRLERTSLKLNMFLNPMLEGLQGEMKHMWHEATLAKSLAPYLDYIDYITHIVTLGSKNSVNDIPWISDHMKWLTQTNVWEIFVWGLEFLVVSVLLYLGSLLVRMLHQCCKDGAVPDISYASYAKQLADSPTKEDVKRLIEKIKQEEPDLQVTPIGTWSLIKMLLPVALDVFLDVNTIRTLILSSNLRFACALTFVVARSTFREWNNFSGLKKAVWESYERGMLHEQLVDLLEEEKGAEAFFSLSITSYSYAFCVQTGKQAVVQWFSILLAAYGIAEFLVQKMEFPTTEFPTKGTVNSFVIVPFEEIQKEKGDA